MGVGLVGKQHTMGNHVCPWWLGYTLITPLRRLQYDPHRLLALYIREGMTVIEPGPGMGYFTLELARLVGPQGRVIAVDLQPKMLARLMRRAKKAGLLERLDVRVAKHHTLGLDDVKAADFAWVFAVLHEVPDSTGFLIELAHALKQGASLFLAEPKGHVSSRVFEEELKAASCAGFQEVERLGVRTALAAILRKT
jgi:ubiquinone/menaquinone biosynthesis C-methylase UbiE